MSPKQQIEFASTGIVVIALGGNAISPSGAGSIQEQFEQTTRTARVLAPRLASNPRAVITHGNGPQIGSAVRRVELASSEVYDLPLSICVADLQGGMGYMIGQCINNELAAIGSAHRVATVVTSVEVDAGDPAFDEPTKPIGPYYTEDRAQTLMAAGWSMVDVPERGFRRVVPSPRPQAIREIDLIRRVVESGKPIIAVGGGGVPVARRPDGREHGLDAVVDKDLSAALLAGAVDAALLFIVTDVPTVFVDFGTPHQRAVPHLTRDEAAAHLRDGQFPDGSMGPKIEGAITFLDRSERDDAAVLITNIENMSQALAGDAGTRITR